MNACASPTRVAIVTGAAQGIGQGIATRLAADGHTVILVDLLEDVVGTADLLRGEGADAHSRIADITDEESVITCTESVLEAYGRIDVLINNAGISPKVGGIRCPSDEVSAEEWSRVVAVNLTGAFLFSRAVLPVMASTNFGRIVNIASQAARTAASVAGVHYGAAKTGMLGLTRTLALEFAYAGITVNAVAPGRIDTPMMTAADSNTNDSLLASIPVGRVGTPADIAAAVAFLSSEEASFITGAVLDVNGGSFMG